MAIKYFKNFPLIQYGELSARNIILKAKLAKDLLNSYDSFYPYTIKDGEKPTTLAYDYYGSIEYVWLIFVANNIIDPYYDWPLDQLQFEEFIKSKYGSLGFAYNINNAQFYTNPQHTYYMTSTTYQNISASERTGWQPISIYDFETIKNEEKRKIRLLDRSLAVDIALELEQVFKKVNRA